MKVTIKHYNEEVTLSINEDQYEKTGLDETSSDEALDLCIRALSVFYDKQHIDGDVVELAYQRQQEEQVKLY